MKTIKNQIALIVGITLVLGLAHVGARGQDATSADKKAKPERPARPAKPSNAGEHADAGELKQIIEKFQTDKKEYLKQLKDAQLEKRRDIRNQLGDKPSLGEAIQEAKDSVVEAKQQAKEQARKLADEAKENAKEGRKRD